MTVFYQRKVRFDLYDDYKTINGVNVFVKQTEIGFRYSWNIGNFNYTMYEQKKLSGYDLQEKIKECL